MRPFNTCWVARPSAVRVLSMALAAGCLFAADARAFTFSDGTTIACRSFDGRAVEEVILPSLAAPFLHGGYTGVTIVNPDGSARTTWDGGKLDALPAAVHDFIYFHECAHAKVPTS